MLIVVLIMETPPTFAAYVGGLYVAIASALGEIVMSLTCSVIPSFNCDLKFPGLVTRVAALNPPKRVHSALRC